MPIETTEIEFYIVVGPKSVYGEPDNPVDHTSWEIHAEESEALSNFQDNVGAERTRTLKVRLTIPTAQLTEVRGALPATGGDEFTMEVK
ncbi:MAG: hypothetical protein NW215_10715 [Hyphomicrobiales bacterium]|nr:hypothetical protein [Hyphomicrobiales bacterium]